MPLTAPDRELIKRCLNHQDGAWNEFVDQYLGLIYHVVTHAAHLRSYPIQPHETEDIAANVLLQVIEKDYNVLKQFRGNSSLSSYLTVIARRICVQDLAKRAGIKEVSAAVEPSVKPDHAVDAREQINKLMKRLPEKDRQIVRMYHLEGFSYEEISEELDIPINSIGSILTRARKKMKGDDSE